MLLIDWDGVVGHYHLGFQTLVYHVTLSCEQTFVASHLDTLERLMDVVDLTIWTDCLSRTANLLLGDNFGSRTSRSVLTRLGGLTGSLGLLVAERSSHVEINAVSLSLT